MYRLLTALILLLALTLSAVAWRMGGGAAGGGGVPGNALTDNGGVVLTTNGGDVLTR